MTAFLTPIKASTTNQKKCRINSHSHNLKPLSPQIFHQPSLKTLKSNANYEHENKNNGRMIKANIIRPYKINIILLCFIVPALLVGPLMIFGNMNDTSWVISIYTSTDVLASTLCCCLLWCSKFSLHNSFWFSHGNLVCSNVCFQIPFPWKDEKTHSWLLRTYVHFISNSAHGNRYKHIIWKQTDLMHLLMKCGFLATTCDSEICSIWSGTYLQRSVLQLVKGDITMRTHIQNCNHQVLQVLPFTHSNLQKDQC